MTPGLSALVVANAADSDPGHVGERLEQRGFRLRTTLREDGGVAGIVDSVRSVDVVVLLGSEWSVHSPVDTAALKAECALVRSAMAAGIPVLAICYGAQVVAAACGGVVERAARPEIGWIRVDPTEETDLVVDGPWLAFHTDVVEPPPHARLLARNDCGAQAFLLPGVLAVQFHPEVRPDVVLDWARRFPDLVSEAGLDAPELVAQSRAREPEARAAAHALVDSFLDAVATSDRLQPRDRSRP